MEQSEICVLCVRITTSGCWCHGDWGEKLPRGASEERHRGLRSGAPERGRESTSGLRLRGAGTRGEKIPWGPPLQGPRRGAARGATKNYLGARLPQVLLCRADGVAVDF